jgi:hypothetical protein
MLATAPGFCISLLMRGAVPGTVSAPGSLNLYHTSLPTPVQLLASLGWNPDGDQSAEVARPTVRLQGSVDGVLAVVDGGVLHWCLPPPGAATGFATSEYSFSILRSNVSRPPIPADPSILPVPASVLLLPSTRIFLASRGSARPPLIHVVTDCDPTFGISRVDIQTPSVNAARFLVMNSRFWVFHLMLVENELLRLRPSHAHRPAVVYAEEDFEPSQYDFVGTDEWLMSQEPINVLFAELFLP